MHLPDRVEPWHLAALVALVALLAVAWGAWMTWCALRALRRVEALGNETRQIALDHRRQFFAFAADQGWSDNMKLTQVADMKTLKETKP